MMNMSNTNQESQCLKTLTKEEEGVDCVHDQEIRNSGRKSHDEPVSGTTSGCNGGMLAMSSAAGRGFGRAYSLQQQQQHSVNGSVFVGPPSGRGFGRAYALQQQQHQSANGSVLVGPPSGRGFGRGYALLHRRVRNEDPSNQPPNPEPVPASDSDHEQIPNESASSGTDVTGVIGVMSTMMSRRRGFGRGYTLLHPSVVNNERVPATPHDPVTVPDHGPFATYIDNAVNNTK
nr:hypothetical protein [Tanacetum cinerariifolium]